MYYYCLSYLYESENTDCGFSPMFMHLPVTNRYTNHKKTALKWFDDAVKCAVKSWNGNKLINVRDIPLDYDCTIKQALFECNEAAYLKGRYLIELRCYTHNPCE